MAGECHKHGELAVRDVTKYRSRSSLATKMEFVAIITPPGRKALTSYAESSTFSFTKLPVVQLENVVAL